MSHDVTGTCPGLHAIDRCARNAAAEADDDDDDDVVFPVI